MVPSPANLNKRQPWVSIEKAPRQWLENREFKKPRRRRWGQRRLKMNLYFTYESRDTLKSFSLFLTVKITSQLNMEHSVKFGI